MSLNAGCHPCKTTISTATVIMAVALSFLCVSCRKNTKQLGEAITNRDSVSVMTTYGVDMLISEEGRIRYKVNAEEWKVFDMMKPPFYALERGVRLELLDSLQQVESLIEADTAYYYDEYLWELRHNVHAENINREKFDSQLMFWDRRKGMIYSDSLIRIEQEDQVIIGHGFESNNNLTDYTIRRTEGVFPIQE
ncbi:MAG: LPS export ABC transporter periplasmic protein LptC [Bacteroidaceae bacterium]|nr:LPS export ABC transporter periplasmic protein LptC [Bacteroidaceae bacterium]MBO7588910.1 LPS export ABC transporter periplasmic protein LptC [Bacteroidaceae bacterium]MBP5646533.1 LPS export ABC transporter periplasmic protein LptC [Bacteroidaceae bacterium]